MKNTLLTAGLLAAVLAAGCTAPAAGTAETTPNPAAVEKPPAASPEEKAARNALKPGAQMPAFTLKNSRNQPVSSAELLARGHLVVVFYRGDWCPYCNLYLKKLQDNLPQIKKAGGELVAISVEDPDDSLSVAEKNDVKFNVLSDPQLEVAKKFGIVYELSRETDEKYKSKGLNVAENNRMNKPQLPLGATYVVNRNGEIVYAFLDTDFKQRAEPEVIVAELEKIKTENK